MDYADGLIQFLMLIALLTFHEFAHAWTGMKLGDDTARLQGRVSLNPVVHIDPIGTILLPLVMIFMPGAGQFLLGWAKPVPFNPRNLAYPQRDEILISMAGPAMNLILGVALMGIARICQSFHYMDVGDLFISAAQLSLLLCFFNLLPVPPLDGSHVLRFMVGMGEEAYANFARFGFVIVIVLLQIPIFRQELAQITHGTLEILARLFGIM